MGESAHQPRKGGKGKGGFYSGSGPVMMMGEHPAPIYGMQPTLGMMPFPEDHLSGDYGYGYGLGYSAAPLAPHLEPSALGGGYLLTPGGYSNGIVGYSGDMGYGGGYSAGGYASSVGGYSGDAYG